MPKQRKRLTKAEFAVLLAAASAYLPNFKDDEDEKRLDALRSAMDKIYDRI